MMIQSFPRIQIGKRISAVGFILCSLMLAFVAFGKPYHNWDMIAYVAATLSDGEQTAGEVHQETWRLVVSHVNEKEFEQLSNEDHYRRVQYADAEAFMSMLPMYEVKMGYIAVLKALSTLFDPIQSMMLVSAASAIGIIFVMAAASQNAGGPLTLAWLPLAGVLGIIPLARYSTPDGLATCFYVAGIFLLLKRQVATAVAFLLIGVAVRPDNVLLNVALAAVIFAISRPGSAVLALGSGVIYLTAGAWSDHIGWWPHFYFTFIDTQPTFAGFDRQPTLIGFDPNFDFILYLKAIVYSVIGLFLKDWLFLPIAALLILAVLLPVARDKFATWVVLALTASFAARFVIFPITEGRIYSPHFFGLGVVILYLLSLCGDANGRGVELDRAEKPDLASGRSRRQAPKNALGRIRRLG